MTKSVSRNTIQTDELKRLITHYQIRDSVIKTGLDKETREKISKANKGKVRSEEFKQFQSEKGKKYRHSEESKQKISKAHKGRERSKEHQENLTTAIRKQRKGKTLDEIYGIEKANRIRERLHIASLKKPKRKSISEKQKAILSAKRKGKSWD